MRAAAFGGSSVVWLAFFVSDGGNRKRVRKRVQGKEEREECLRAGRNGASACFGARPKLLLCFEMGI